MVDISTRLRVVVICAVRHARRLIDCWMRRQLLLACTVVFLLNKLSVYPYPSMKIDVKAEKSESAWQKVRYCILRLETVGFDKET